MKFKYYLRGIGIGIVFASIVFLTAYRSYLPAKMTNDEIIERAKQLGMIEANEPINKLIDKKNEEVKSTSEENTAEEVTTEAKTTTEEVTTEAKTTTEEVTTEAKTTTEEVTTEAKTTTEKVTTEAKTTTEKVTTEAKTTAEKVTTEAKTTAEKVTTEAKTTTEKITTEAKNDGKKQNETVEITISRGSSSYPVCQKLQELGLIDDAAKFDDYLIENGYANRISVGTHKLTKGMDYHTIAELISDPLD